MPIQHQQHLQAVMHLLILYDTLFLAKHFPVKQAEQKNDMVNVLYN